MSELSDLDFCRNCEDIMGFLTQNGYRLEVFLVFDKTIAHIVTELQVGYRRGKQTGLVVPAAYNVQEIV